MGKLVPPIKYHGGKTRIANWIHEISKPMEGLYKHRVYVFGGGAGEAWSWNAEGVSECYNDIDYRLSNFFRVLQDKAMFENFLRKAEATPFSEVEWQEAHFLNNIDRRVSWDTKSNDERVMIALAFFVDCRQSLGGMMASFAPLSKRRIRRGMNEQTSAWLGSIEGLRTVHERLTRMAIRCTHWQKIIDNEDTKDTLFYLDPPYLKETRVSKEVYSNEFTKEQHVELLDRLGSISGKFMLSGYHSNLYDDWANSGNFNHHELVTDCKSSHKAIKDKRTEVIWTNF